MSATERTIRTKAKNLRVGRQLLTDDGWQTINGLVIFIDADQVSVFTAERDDVNTDGWRFHLNDRVQTQRAARADRRVVQPAECPAWCIEHYTGSEGDSCHSSKPLTVPAADVYTGAKVELGLWVERRNHVVDGTTETVGVLEVRRITEDIELSPRAMRRLAAKLQSLADRADGRH